MNIYIRGLKMQNFCSQHFNVKICALYKNKNKKIYFPYFFFIIICRFIPFIIIKYLLYLINYQIIYITNNIYNITNNNNIRIIPIIMNFIIIDKNNNIHDLTPLIKFYNPSIPLQFLFKNNKITNPIEIKINYLSEGVIKKDILILNDYNIQIYELFTNI